MYNNDTRIHVSIDFCSADIVYYQHDYVKAMFAVCQRFSITVVWYKPMHGYAVFNLLVGSFQHVKYCG